MRDIRRYLVATVLAGGLALAGALGVTASSAAAESTTAAETAAPASVQAQGWLWVSRWQTVFTTYGGPSVLGTTADELIYAYCQHDGIWGWQTYAWVPSLNAAGWLRNGDITGYTNPIANLDVC
jgi:hypothetical protein